MHDHAPNPAPPDPAPSDPIQSDAPPADPYPADQPPSDQLGADHAQRLLVDRRSGLDRRTLNEQRRAILGQEPPPDDPEASKHGTIADLNRRRGPGRRRTDFTRAAEEGQMSKEQFLFLMAIDEFKRANNKTFPSWTDVLEVIRLLGYRKTAPSQIKVARAEDWRERPDAPSNVRDKPGHRPEQHA